MIVWSLTTDTDIGLNTDLYLTEYQTYEALIRDVLPEESHPSCNGEATAALERGIPELVKYLESYFSSGEVDGRYQITKHDHPWTFGPDTEDERFGKLREFLAESPLPVVEAQAVSDIIDGPRKTAGDSEVREDDELPETIQ